MRPNTLPRNPAADAICRYYEVNGEVRQISVDDKKASVDNVSRLKADPGDSSQVGAPMAGVLVELRVHDGSEVKKGDPLAVLSAMKMGTCYISRPIDSFLQM